MSFISFCFPSLGVGLFFLLRVGFFVFVFMCFHPFCFPPSFGNLLVSLRVQNEWVVLFFFVFRFRVDEFHFFLFSIVGRRSFFFTRSFFFFSCLLRVGFFVFVFMCFHPFCFPPSFGNLLVSRFGFASKWMGCSFLFCVSLSGWWVSFLFVFHRWASVFFFTSGRFLRLSFHVFHPFCFPPSFGNLLVSLRIQNEWVVLFFFVFRFRVDDFHFFLFSIVGRRSFFLLRVGFFVFVFMCFHPFCFPPSFGNLLISLRIQNEWVVLFCVFASLSDCVFFVSFCFPSLGVGLFFVLLGRTSFLSFVCTSLFFPTIVRQSFMVDFHSKWMGCSFLVCAPLSGWRCFFNFCFPSLGVGLFFLLRGSVCFHPLGFTPSFVALSWSILARNEWIVLIFCAPCSGWLLFASFLFSMFGCRCFVLLYTSGCVSSSLLSCFFFCLHPFCFPPSFVKLSFSILARNEWNRFLVFHGWVFVVFFSLRVLLFSLCDLVLSFFRLFTYLAYSSGYTTQFKEIIARKTSFRRNFRSPQHLRRHKTPYL